MRVAALMFTLATITFIVIGNLASYVCAVIYGAAAIDCWAHEFRK